MGTRRSLPTPLTSTEVLKLYIKEKMTSTRGRSVITVTRMRNGDSRLNYAQLLTVRTVHATPQTVKVVNTIATVMLITCSGSQCLYVSCKQWTHIQRKWCLSLCTHETTLRISVTGKNRMYGYELVRQRTIPTERPPLVSEVDCGDSLRWLRKTLYPLMLAL
jgi:hypothetical protein